MTGSMTSRNQIVCALAVFLWATSVFAGEVDNEDPWVGFNRAMFKFNDTLDVYVLEPVARAWHFVMPDAVERGVSNFFSNLAIPRYLVNHLLQGKPRAAGDDVKRLFVNSTFGVIGLVDVATDWGLSENEEDFGQTLGVWGVPAGPYLVLPFLGPSSPRDALGDAVDTGTSVYWYFIPLAPNFTLRGISVINLRAEYLDTVRQAKEASLDYYAAVRDAYRRRRQANVEDRTDTAEQDEDLYRIEE